MNDALIVRVASLLPALPFKYRGQQAASGDYILFESDDEREAPDWSDKDQQAGEFGHVLQIWGSDPRTLAGYAKTIIDSLAVTPLAITSFNHLRTALERNAGGQDGFTVEGQGTQFLRRVQFRYYYQPR